MMVVLTIALPWAFTPAEPFHQIIIAASAGGGQILNLPNGNPGGQFYVMIPQVTKWVE